LNDLYWCGSIGWHLGVNYHILHESTVLNDSRCTLKGLVFHGHIKAVDTEVIWEVKTIMEILFN